MGGTKLAPGAHNMKEDEEASALEQIVEAYAKAKGTFTGATWTHEYAPTNSNHGIPREYCFGEENEAMCLYCRDAGISARQAEAEAAEAMRLLHDGDPEAASRARAAARMEREYGDDPTWGVFARLMGAWDDAISGRRTRH